MTDKKLIAVKCPESTDEWGFKENGVYISGLHILVRHSDGLINNVDIIIKGDTYRLSNLELRALLKVIVRGGYRLE